MEIATPVDVLGEGTISEGGLRKECGCFGWMAVSLILLWLSRWDGGTGRRGTLQNDSRRKHSMRAPLVHVPAPLSPGGTPRIGSGHSSGPKTKGGLRNEYGFF